MFLLNVKYTAFHRNTSQLIVDERSGIVNLENE